MCGDRSVLLCVVCFISFKIGLFTSVPVEFLPKNRFQRDCVFCLQYCRNVYKELPRHRTYLSLNAMNGGTIQKLPFGVNTMIGLKNITQLLSKVT